MDGYRRGWVVTDVRVRATSHPPDATSGLSSSAEKSNPNRSGRSKARRTLGIAADCSRRKAERAALPPQAAGLTIEFRIERRGLMKWDGVDRVSPVARGRESRRASEHA